MIWRQEDHKEIDLHLKTEAVYRPETVELLTSGWLLVTYKLKKVLYPPWRIESVSFKLPEKEGTGAEGPGIAGQDPARWRVPRPTERERF